MESMRSEKVIIYALQPVCQEVSSTFRLKQLDHMYYEQQIGFSPFTPMLVFGAGIDKFLSTESLSWTGMGPQAYAWRANNLLITYAF